MSTLNPSLVMIGPFPSLFQSLGAEIYQDLQSARKALESNSCEVLAISLTALKQSLFISYWAKMQKSKKQTQLILITPESYRSSDLLELYESYPIFRWRTSFEDEDLLKDLHEALERSRHLQQQETMRELLQQETKDLELFQNDLENRVQRRAKYLVDSRRKLFLMNTRMEIFRELLMGFQQTCSFAELEEILNQTLNARMEVQWIRLLLGSEDKPPVSSLDSEFNYASIVVPLFHGDHRLGSLYFLKAKPGSFSKDDTDFFRQVGETVALVIERISKAAELRSLKSQWDSTFQAISHPIALIDAQYVNIQSNRSVSRLHCYEVLFDRSAPCPSCQRGENFFLEHGGETYQVNSQRVGSSFLNLYHNKTKELRMEAQVLESARNAELGTIGSSIAHELNNPLGGLLTFLQMIERDLPPESPWLQDIQEMEKGAQRCREIIQNLLIFIRNPDLSSESNFNLNELTEQTFKISEIQAKALNVKIEWKPGPKLPELRGNPSLVAQALRNLIQIGINHSKNSNLKVGSQFVSSDSSPTLEWRLEMPNDVDLKNLSNTNFSWALAKQILLDQGASVDLGKTIVVRFSNCIGSKTLPSESPVS